MNQGFAEFFAPGDELDAPRCALDRPDRALDPQDFMPEPAHAGELLAPRPELSAEPPKLGLIVGGRSPGREPLTGEQQVLVQSVRDLAKQKVRWVAPEARGAVFDDLFQAAMEAAVWAARRFNSTAGTRFVSFVVPWMVGAIRDAREKEGRESRLIRAGVMAGRMWAAERSGRFAPPIEDDEVSQRRLDDISEQLAQTYELAMGLELPEPDEGPEERAAWELIKRAMASVLRVLSAWENEVLVLRFLEHKSYVEIAEAMELPSEDAARKRVEWVLEKLRRFLSEAGVNELPRGRYRR